MSQPNSQLPKTDSPLPTNRTTAGVLFGDLAVLFAFIATGQYAHQYYFWELPVHTLLVFSPFVVAWLVVAPIAGLFRPDVLASYRLTVAILVPAWIAATLLGGLIRSTAFFPGSAPIDFLAANVAFGLLFLVPWRVLVSWLYRRRLGE